MGREARRALHHHGLSLWIPSFIDGRPRLQFQLGQNHLSALVIRLALSPLSAFS
jgi:hypothetical protein